MKIALLNLPIDINYGGNIQRYALITVLRKLGHDVEHLQLIKHRSFRLPLYKKYMVYLKRILFIIFGTKTKSLFYEKKLKQGYDNFMYFYNKYIPHTEMTFSDYSDFLNYDWNKYNAIIVGSDQVWRPDMTKSIGIEAYFLSFIKEVKIRRIAYAVSFGKCNALFDNILEIKDLYNKFDAVSVREKDGEVILKNSGLLIPKPVLVLDPTLLLSRDDYVMLLNEEKISLPLNNKYLLTYFINDNLYDKSIVKMISDKRNLNVIDMTMYSAHKISIPEWIKYFMYADYVVTDSYHGFVFSLLFNKPVKVVNNLHGGLSRFKSLMEILEIKDIDNVDWENVNKLLSYYRNLSLDFLNKALS